MNEPSSSSELRPVRVWDLPTRLFHWTLALAIVGLLITSKIAGNALVWHMRLGLLVLALLVFRLLWGVVGGHWSRFARFAYAPSTTLRYLRGEHRAGDHFDVGHNPLGAFSVFAMLGILVVQVATGLFANDEIATTGPLNRFVSESTGIALTSWHKGPGQWTIIVLVVLHIGAIVFYRLRGTGLVAPMWAGDKLLPATVPPTLDGVRQRVLALVLFAACAALSVYIERLGA
ncbi:cytochrome b/b6 domain-containing protein [Aquabacterium humicola]|uniref:cytochrome b/b6 domain-containing protein n=1 Tax=Aquabacterium humicola TaxID=3237377 RepID=UPI0025436B7B|nr:cytochrome b/b6 domain-containing protein [Rubrivivax pictus]